MHHSTKQTMKKDKPINPKTKIQTRGFTLIEVLIVFALIGILVGLGLPQYKNATTRAREATLKENLYILRQLLGQYYSDKGKYPTSLQTLVDEEYLYKIPVDPITKSSSTWVELQELLTDEDLIAGVQPGISDIRSGSEKTALDGTLYNTW